MITSPQNPRLQRVRALLDKRKQREEESAFVIEGVRMAEEGLHSGWQAELVLFTNLLPERGKDVVRAFERANVEAVDVEPRLFHSIAGTENPQGLMVVFKKPETPLPRQADFILVADNLRDPGNLGTLLRSAAAAGVQAVLLSPGTTDAFAPKVLRAGMGAHFRLPVLHLTWDEIESVCRANKVQVLLADASEGISCWETDFRLPTALVIGSEAEGASSEAEGLADHLVRIPMPGASESLNASAAASILLFEVVRQRATPAR